MTRPPDPPDDDSAKSTALAHADESSTPAIWLDSEPLVPNSDRDVGRVALCYAALCGLGVATWGAGFLVAGALGWMVSRPLTTALYAHRGHSLLTLLVRYDRRTPGPRSLALFERIARTRLFGRPVRRDAAARAALHRLERGELEPMLTILGVPDDEMSRPVASNGSGAFGSIIRSIIGHLVPEASLPITAVDVFDAPSSDPLRMSLELLETLTAGRTLAALRIWASMDVQHLDARHPTLLTLIHGAVVDVDPAERNAFIARLDRLEPAAAHLVRRRYPELTTRDDGYRQAPRPQHLTTVLAVPQTVLALRAASLPAIGEPAPLAQTTTLIGGILGVPCLLGVLFGVSGGAMAALILASGLIYGFTTKAVHLKSEEKKRMDTFRTAGITAAARLEELKYTTTDPMLVIALHRAERALEDGQIDDARELVGWWFQGLSAEEIRARPIHVVAASALRTATLLGYESVVSPLILGIEMDTAPRWASGHGNAEQALRLAQSLSLAMRGRYAQAGRRFRQATMAHPVALDDYETHLYAELARRLLANHQRVPPLSRPSVTPAPWVGQAWPPTG